MNLISRSTLLGLVTIAAGSIAATPAHAGTEAPLTPCASSFLLSSILGSGCSVEDINYHFSSTAYSGSKAASAINVTAGKADMAGLMTTISFQATAPGILSWSGMGSLVYTATVNTLSNRPIDMLSGQVGSSIMGTNLTASVTGTGTTSGGPCALSVPGITDCSLSGWNYDPNVDSTVVTTTWNVTAGGMQNFTSTITQTPGPLPILGAGAAFGFSRKLRRRINASV